MKFEIILLNCALRIGVIQSVFAHFTETRTNCLVREQKKNKGMTISRLDYFMYGL